MDKLQIAVAGAGLIGRRHIELVNESNRCSLSAIVDPTDSAKELAGSLCVKHFSSLNDMFRQHTPSGIILATPNNLHVETERSLNLRDDATGRLRKRSRTFQIPSG